MYSLASSGAIDSQRLRVELATNLRTDGHDPQVTEWSRQLVKWIARQPDRGMVYDWHERMKDSAAPFLGRIASHVEPA
jgi:hypothetical protein